MIQYELPIPEIMFLTRHVLGLSQTLELPGYEECDEDTFTAAVNAIGRFSSEVLLPINADGDRIGSKLDRGEVKAPPGFSVAYKQFCEDGWNSLPFELEHGGQLPPRLRNTDPPFAERTTGTNDPMAAVP